MVVTLEGVVKGSDKSPAWLRGLGVVQQSKRSPVRFPVGAHVWVWVLSLVQAHSRGNQLMFVSHIDVSLPPSSSFPLSLEIRK